MAIPENSSVLMPRLICRDPRAAVDFYVETFEARSLNERPGPDGSLAHALLSIGPAMIMVEAEWPTLPSRAPAADGSSSVVLFLYVDAVDQTLARAVTNGGTVLVPLQNQFWGDRIAWVMDPAGHVWTVASRIEDTTAEERTRRWSEILEKSGGVSPSTDRPGRPAPSAPSSSRAADDPQPATARHRRSP